MYAKIRGSIEHHIDRIGRILMAVVIILWILSQFFPKVEEWVVLKGLINVLMLALLVEAITYLVELKKKSTEEGSSRIFQNQQYANQELDQFIREQEPRKADLIELSSGTIRGLLELLKDQDCYIRLLVQHPEKAASSFELKRIVSELNSLLEVTFKDYNKVEIKCYATPASIRGRNFDDKLINIGWYTYHDIHEDLIDEIKITGHTNPMINVYSDTSEGQTLRQFFTKAFNQLWEHAVPFEDVMATIDSTM